MTNPQAEMRQQLMNALYHDDFSTVDNLLKQGVNINLPYNHHGWTPFMWICKEHCNPEIITKFLICAVELIKPISTAIHHCTLPYLTFKPTFVWMLYRSIKRLPIGRLVKLWEMGFKYQGCPVVEYIKHNGNHRINYIKNNRLLTKHYKYGEMPPFSNALQILLERLRNVYEPTDYYRTIENLSETLKILAYSVLNSVTQDKIKTLVFRKKYTVYTIS